MVLQRMNYNRIQCKIPPLILLDFQLDCSEFGSLIGRLSLLLLVKGCFDFQDIRSQALVK